MLANPDEMPLPYQSCRGTSQEPPPLRPPGATAPVRHAAFRAGSRSRLAFSHLAPRNALATGGSARRIIHAAPPTVVPCAR